MKKLILIRHAKSMWKEKIIEDIDRPLSERGIKSAYEVASVYKKANKIPHLLITSPATRAISTCMIFSRVWKHKKIEIQDEIYHQSPLEIIKSIKNTSDKINSIAIFGHEPEIGLVFQKLCSHQIDKFVTCGLIEIEFNTTNWQEISKKNSTFTQYIKPKIL